MTKQEREVFDKAREGLKASIMQETPFKQIYQFAEWLYEKLNTVWHR